MGRTIAVTGKGGVGKTTFTALLIRLLVESKQGAVLAVDADPNLNLDAALGLTLTDTVGDLREEGLDRAQSLPGGMAKAEFLQLRVQQALAESEGFDLLAMGRPEGPGCYCFANSILRACVDKIGKQYAYVVIDCEAGLEHLSRRTAGDVDALFLLSDPSLRSLETAARVMRLIEELHTGVGERVLAFTRVVDGISDELRAAARDRGLPKPFLIPEDAELRNLDMQGKPLVDVSQNSPALAAVRKIMTETGLLPR